MADNFRQAFEQVVAATQQFYAGDSAPFKALWSRGDDVTIFGGWGAYERGWEQVDKRLDWAASRFREGRGTVEPLGMSESGDLAYAVYLEKSEVQVEGQEARQPMVLRVTHIYRREDGVWKIIHRHADAVAQKVEPTAVLQR